MGHPRPYTTLAWPLTDTDPQVCARISEFRDENVSSPSALAGEWRSCAQVSWDDLAGIQALIYAQSGLVQRERRLGLSKVSSLALHSIYQAALPARLLLHSSQLRHLPLVLADDNTGFPFPDLPTDLLTHTPHLHSLHLEIRQPA